MPECKDIQCQQSCEVSYGQGNGSLQPVMAHVSATPPNNTSVFSINYRTQYDSFDFLKLTLCTTRGMLNNNDKNKVVFKKRHTGFEGLIKIPIPHQEHLPALESQDPFRQKS